MILLDTHVWIWWVHGARDRIGAYVDILDTLGPKQVGISVVSLWEAAYAICRGRVEIKTTLDQWLQEASTSPQIRLLPLTPKVAIAAAQLPGQIHKDPSDRFLVAEARSRNCILVTEDKQILDYDGVRAVRCKQLADALMQ